ncbi:MAG TPA: hypothetical protein VIV58_15350 [Kofleriaceae bacterium]
MRPAVVIGFGVVLAAASVHADPPANAKRVAALGGPPGEEPPHVAAWVPPAPIADVLAQRRDADAASDRSFGRSTAIPLDGGQFDFSMRTAVEDGSMISMAAGFGYGVELSADAGYGRQLGHTYGLGLKYAFERHATWAIAVDTSVHSIGIDRTSDDGTMWSADLKLTTCAASCGMLFTAAAGAVYVQQSYNSSSPTPFLELAMVFGTGLVRPMIEGISLSGDQNLGFAGFRLGGKHVAVDLGVGLGATLGGSSDSFTAMMLGLGVRP